MYFHLILRFKTEAMELRPSPFNGKDVSIFKNCQLIQNSTLHFMLTPFLRRNVELEIGKKYFGNENFPCKYRYSNV